MDSPSCEGIHAQLQKPKKAIKNKDKPEKKHE